MSTVAALESEIQLQLDFLKNFQPQKPIPKQKQRKTIFCGAGDSFVSALLAEVFSDFRIRTIDPLDLSKNMNILRNRDLYVVSISGNTMSNILLAKKAKNAVAITSIPSSKLARASKKIILLKFKKSWLQTAGSITFLQAHSRAFHLPLNTKCLTMLNYSN